MEIITCKNCGHQFSGKFCSNCSQPSDTGKINSKYIIKELQKTFIRFDSGFFYTTKKLFQNPGKALLEYIKGERIDHLRPFSYLIIITGVYILLLSNFHLAIVNAGLGAYNQSTTDTFIRSHFAQIQIVLIVFYALISVGLFHYRHFNFYEFIVIHTYLAGQRILINICLMPLHAWHKTASYTSYLDGLTFLISNGLMIWAYVVLFAQKNTVLVIAKTILLQLILLVLLIFALSRFL
jgi:hypothetical protein